MTDISDKFHGVFPVLVTPFTENGEIDEKPLKEQVRYLIKEGVHGIVANGSTGEFAFLNDDERKQVMDIVIYAADGAVPVIVGTADVATERVVMFTEYAEKYGADGVMIVAPYYGSFTDEEIFQHYETIDENTNLPIMFYNNPGASGTRIEQGVIEKISELENVLYLKESSGKWPIFIDIKDRCKDNVKIFCGCDTLALDMFKNGAVGWVVPVGNLIPKQCVELYNFAVVQKDYEKAEGLNTRLSPILHAFEDTGKYVQFAKAGLKILGRPYGKPRRPLLPATEEEEHMLQEMLYDIL